MELSETQIKFFLRLTLIGFAALLSIQHTPDRIIYQVKSGYSLHQVLRILRLLSIRVCNKDGGKNSGHYPFLTKVETCCLENLSRGFTNCTWSLPKKNINICQLFSVWMLGKSVLHVLIHCPDATKKVWKSLTIHPSLKSTFRLSFADILHLLSEL